MRWAGELHWCNFESNTEDALQCIGVIAVGFSDVMADAEVPAMDGVGKHGPDRAAPKSHLNKVPSQSQAKHGSAPPRQVPRPKELVLLRKS